MEKKVGWIWIIGAFLLFIVNFITFGNKVMFTASWASIVSGIIGFLICPLLIFIGIIIFILGGKKKK